LHRRAARGPAAAAGREPSARHAAPSTAGPTWIHGDLRAADPRAWQAKEFLRDLATPPTVARTSLPTTPRSPPPATASQAHIADHAHRPGLLVLAETVEQCWDVIQTYLTTRSANAPSEGDDRLVKLEARDPAGLRTTPSVTLCS
jgi:transposase